MSDGSEPAPKKDRNTRRIAGITIALTVLVMIGLYLLFDVCDEQVTSTGKVVKACRHMQATDAPILGLGVILLVGLGAFFTEISILGLTVKRQLDEVKEKQNKMGEKVDRTAEKADQTAEETHKTAERADEIAATVGRTTEKVNETAADAADFHARLLSQETVGPIASVQAVAAPPGIVDLAERY